MARDASSCVVVEAVTVLICDISKLNKPFTLDSCFAVRSTHQNPYFAYNVGLNHVNHAGINQVIDLDLNHVNHVG